MLFQKKFNDINHLLYELRDTVDFSSLDPACHFVKAF